MYVIPHAAGVRDQAGALAGPARQCDCGGSERPMLSQAALGGRQ
jgi:hypothetical protein